MTLQGPQPNSPLAKPQLEGKDVAAIVLSFILPGVGHMLIGQTTRGLAILGGTILTCGIGYILTIAVAADAYLVAMTSKERQVGTWEFFPEHKKFLNI
jgi:TM2 domain-containing membrane protein YozV